jgi:hypothetical protein
VLVRAHRIQSDPELLTLAIAAARPFELNVEHGGVRSDGRRGPLFEEYPGQPPPRVLDGTLFALLGMYDVVAETDNNRLRELFEGGLDGLEGQLADWDYRGKWSWYGRRRYLSPTHYHFINRTLLLAASRVSGRRVFADMAARWDPRRLDALDRAEVYLAFQATKQWSRLRNRLPNSRLYVRA